MATRRNLCVKPNFEGAFEWHENATLSTEHPHDGTHSMKLTTPGAATFEGAYVGSAGFVPSIEGSKQFTFSFWVHVEPGSAWIGKSLNFNLSEQTAEEGFIRNDGGGGVLAVGDNRVSGTFTTDSTCRKMYLSLFGPNEKVAGSVWVDSMLVEYGSEVLAYFDGGTTLAGYTTSWEGTANNSVSKAVPAAKTLSLTDSTTPTESLTKKVTKKLTDSTTPSETFTKKATKVLADSTSPTETWGFELIEPEPEPEPEPPPASPRIFLKRVHRRSRLSVIVKAPDGSPITRWAQDEPNLQNVFSGLTFGGEMPGGHKELSLTLHRDPKRSYRDLALFNRIEVWSSDGERVWCGTIRQEPTSDGDQQSIEVKAAGDMQFLEDDPTIVGPGFISSDMSRWTGPSVGRRGALLALHRPSQQDPALIWDSTASALRLEVQGAWTTPTIPLSEAWFDSGEGVGISAVLGDWGDGFADTNFVLSVNFSPDDVGTSELEGHEDFYTATSGHISWGPSFPRRYALITWRYNATNNGVAEATYLVDLFNLKVIGTGLSTAALKEDEGGIGFLAKDMIPAIVEGSALTTDPELLEDDGFVIPHAWFDAPGTRMSKLVEVTKYGLLDWFVFGDRILQYRFPGTYGRTWRLGPGNGPKNSGADANQVFDRLMVSYQDVDGTTKYTDLLTTTDPSNPAAAAGVPRGKLLALNGVCTEKLALEVRQRAFEELQNLSQSGEVTLTDHVQDEASGAWYPVSYVQPGDRVREQSNGHERKVTSTSYSDESVSNSLTIGAPPEGMGAIEAQFNGRLLELGLG